MEITIDEYIERCEEIVRYNEQLAEKDPVYRKNEGWIKATEEHRQLTEWLKDYKRLLESSSEKPNKLENPTRSQKSEWEHEILKAYADGANNALDKVRAELAEYASIWVEYKITGRRDKDIERLVSDVLKQAKKQVLDIIDKYKAENEQE